MCNPATRCDLILLVRGRVFLRRDKHATQAAWGQQTIWVPAGEFDGIGLLRHALIRFQPAGLSVPGTGRGISAPDWQRADSLIPHRGRS